MDDYVANLNATAVKGLRIGIPKQYFNVQGLDAEVKARVEESLKKIARHGRDILVEIDLNMTEAYVPTYYLIAPAEAVF